MSILKLEKARNLLGFFTTFNLFLIMIFSIGCTHVFFQPDRYLHHHPTKLKLDYKEIDFTSADNTKLHSWYLIPKEKKSLIIFFHGNAQNLSSHYLSLAWIVEKGHGVFIFDYRGYGKSEGSPDMEGAINDSVAALEAGYKIFKNEGYKNFVVLGQSLGGPIAITSLERFKKRKHVDLLVLDSTFLSFKEIAFDKLKSHWMTFIFSPLSFLLISDKFAAKNYVDKVEIPTLVIHGTKDRVVPYKFGVEVFESLKAVKKKWFWKVEGGIHTDAFILHKKAYQKEFLKLLKGIK